MSTYVLTLCCPDRPGIVHAVTAGLLDVDGNIVDSAQHGDPATERFFLRIVAESPIPDLGAVQAALDARTAPLGAQVQVHAADERCRALLMVSGHQHCLIDLLYRWQIGELPIEVVGVVSNHPDARAVAERYRVPFEHVPVTKETKPAAEARLLELIGEWDADLVVLARYMQILSTELSRELTGRAINIHHSFLPGFKGARPYQQAYDRGVKLIGATAHYVTDDLDEGPIIEQDVVRVDHTRTPDQLTVLGRDVESRVLAAAVLAHAERRVLLNGTRTVVFP